MNCEVRSRDLSGITLGPPYAYEHYFRADEYKYFTEDRYNKQGYVLVELKQVKIGYKIIIQLYSRLWWLWKPEIDWPYRFVKGKIKRNWKDFRFSWLFFNIQIESRFTDYPVKIIGDHWGELHGQSLKGKTIVNERFGFKHKIV